MVARCLAPGGGGARSHPGVPPHTPGALEWELSAVVHLERNRCAWLRLVGLIKPFPTWVFSPGRSAPGIERARFTIVFSRVRAPQNAQSWCLGRPPSTCAHDYFSRFFGVGIQKNEKRAILCVKGAYCELVSSPSSLDKASQREPAIRRVFLRARQQSAYPGE